MAPALLAPIAPLPVPAAIAAPALPLTTYKLIYDDLGPIGAGVTAPKRVRTEDNLLYAAKREMPGQPHTVRASEYIWLSIARLVHLPVTAPEILRDHTGELYCATRLHPNVSMAPVANFNLMQLLSGAIHGAGVQLVRIYAFDLFCGNGDRHPDNYLVLNEGGTMVLHAIDFSHVGAHPGLAQPFGDPAHVPTCATRVFFPVVRQPYGCPPGPGVDIMRKLLALSKGQIEGIVYGMPTGWLAPAESQAVVDWWTSPARAGRANQVIQGLGNGTYL